MGYCRRNFMVPLPEFATWEAFNLWLEEQCRKRQHDVLRGESETIGERLQRDLAAMRPLPVAPFDACDQDSGRVSSQCLVRYCQLFWLSVLKRKNASLGLHCCPCHVGTNICIAARLGSKKLFGKG